MQTDDYVVHIVDDDEAMGKSRTFLAAGFAVRVHPTAADYLAIAPSLGKGCLVAEIGMPGMNGVELLTALKELGVSIPSIVITGHGDVSTAVQAMKAGALEVIEKPFDDQVVIAAIRQAVEKFATSHSNDDADAIRSKIAHLSDREREVLKGIVDGLPNKSIAVALNISPRTVEVHRANVMVKMAARNLPELVRMAASAGLRPDKDDH